MGAVSAEIIDISAPRSIPKEEMSDTDHLPIAPIVFQLPTPSDFKQEPGTAGPSRRKKKHSPIKKEKRSSSIKSEPAQPSTEEADQSIIDITEDTDDEGEETRGHGGQGGSRGGGAQL